MTDNRRIALRFVIGIGIVSLFADFTYEGGRSITGPFLAVLGASPLLVGVIAGVGEFLGYALRLASGRFVDRSGHHWPIIYAGYAINLLALPALALAGNVGVAGGLIFAERLGKGLRTPARDAVLAEASQELGHGYAFGLHEALDQIGALLGPVAIAGAVAWSGYRLGFGVLIIPALLALLCLYYARGLQPSKTAPKETAGTAFSPLYKRYLAFVVVAVLGFSHFQIIAYHLQVSGHVRPFIIPLLFALAMAVDGLVAFIAGRVFDHIGLRVMYALPVLVLAAVALTFLSPNLAAIGIGLVLWGAAMGLHESVMRAAVARLAPPHRRGTAYGLFDASFGAAWMIGSIVMGALYGLSPEALVALTLVTQVLAVLMLLRLRAAMTI